MPSPPCVTAKAIRHGSPDRFKRRFAKNTEQKVFARLFQKAADSKGRAFGRTPQRAKNLCPYSAGGGGKPSPGVPPVFRRNTMLCANRYCFAQQRKILRQELMRSVNPRPRRFFDKTGGPASRGIVRHEQKRKDFLSDMAKNKRESLDKSCSKRYNIRWVYLTNGGRCRGWCGKIFRRVGQNGFSRFLGVSHALSFVYLKFERKRRCMDSCQLF